MERGGKRQKRSSSDTVHGEEEALASSLGGKSSFEEGDDDDFQRVGRQSVADDDEEDDNGDDGEEDNDEDEEDDEDDDEEGALDGEASCLEEVMSNMFLTRFINESHGHPIRDIVGHRHEPFHNLVATVAHDRVTLYDDDHCGGHLDVMMQFVNKPIEGIHDETTDMTLTSCCFVLEPAGQPVVPGSEVKKVGGKAEEDVFLAVAGKDCNVHVLSVAHRRVIHLLQGHTASVDKVVALDWYGVPEGDEGPASALGSKRRSSTDGSGGGDAAAAAAVVVAERRRRQGRGSGRIASLSSGDGTCRLWDIASAACLQVLNLNDLGLPSIPTTMAANDAGTYLAFGGKDATVAVVSLGRGGDGAAVVLENVARKLEEEAAGKKKPWWKLSGAVQDVVFAADDVVVARTTVGHLLRWRFDVAEGAFCQDPVEALPSVKAPSLLDDSEGAGPPGLAVSSCGQLLCCGDDEACAIVVDLSDGSVVGELDNPRQSRLGGCYRLLFSPNNVSISGPDAPHLSADAPFRILASGCKGSFLMRWEFVHPSRE